MEEEIKKPKGKCGGYYPGAGRPRSNKKLVKICDRNIGKYIRITTKRGLVVEGQIWDKAKAVKERVEKTIPIKEWGIQLAPLGRHGMPNGRVTYVKPSYVVKAEYLWNGEVEIFMPEEWKKLEERLTSG